MEHYIPKYIKAKQKGWLLKKGIAQQEKKQIASIMIHLQTIGCHNINLVTPSHGIPQILKALDIAIDYGLNISLVYNCSGYESIGTLRILKNIPLYPYQYHVPIPSYGRC